MSDHIHAEQLKLLIERIEALEEDRRAVAENITDVYAEAKSTGYDPKIVREIVKIRRMDRNDRAEAEALLETYKSALGIE